MTGLWVELHEGSTNIIRVSLKFLCNPLYLCYFDLPSSENQSTQVHRCCKILTCTAYPTCRSSRTQMEGYISLVPRRFKRRRRKGLVHIACACTRKPPKMWGNRILSYTLRLLSIELYVLQNPRTITMVMRPVAMKTPAHVRTVCTKPFLLLFLLLKGLGTRLGVSVHQVQVHNLA